MPTNALRCIESLLECQCKANDSNYTNIFTHEIKQNIRSRLHTLKSVLLNKNLVSKLLVLKVKKKGTKICISSYRKKWVLKILKISPFYTQSIKFYFKKKYYATVSYVPNLTQNGAVEWRRHFKTIMGFSWCSWNS